MDVPSTNWKPKQYLYTGQHSQYCTLRTFFFPVSFAVITAAFHYVFSSSYAPNHFRASLVKHWSIAKAVRTVSQIVTHHTIIIPVFLSQEHAFPEFLTWLLAYFQPTCRSPMESDCPCNKRTKPCISGFPWGCWDHNTLSSKPIHEIV
jgi:hypothetical protein